MPPALAPRDLQATWESAWVLEGPAFPHVCATRDLSVPAVPGDPFSTGDSETGGTDTVGGGSGPDALHAWGRIIGTPVVRRRIADPLFQTLEIQDVTVRIADPEGLWTGDYRAAPFTLSRYDVFSGLRLYDGHFIVAQPSRDRGEITITGTSVDKAILEDKVPDGTVDPVTFPFADAGAKGQTPPWVFGNVTNLPLLNVSDNQVDEEFDYLLNRGADSVAALTGLRRLSRDPAVNQSFIIGFDELEPYPGEAGVLVNGRMEDWDAGAAVAPTGWTLGGTGTVAKTTVAADVDEGSAAATVAATGANARLTQDLMVNAPTLGLAWWRGREMSIVASGKTVTAANAFLRVSDGVATVDTAFHTGGGLYEDFVVGTIAVPFVVNAAATILSVQLRQVGAGTCHWDNVRVFLRANSWAEIPRTLYDGYTAIRFWFRQEDASGALHQIVADFNGLQPERNPARAARSIISDATHGLGRPVDAASFDQAEAETCVTHEAAGLLYGPELFLPFRDVVDTPTAQTVVVHDRSGHERHGLYDKGARAEIGIDAFNGPSGSGVVDGNDAYMEMSGDGESVTVPSHPAYSGQTISLRVTIRLGVASLPDPDIYPVVEKLVGLNALSGYSVIRNNSTLQWSVRGVDAVLYSIAFPLVDVLDENRWIDVVCTAAGGVLAMYRDGATTPVATGTYGAAITEGDGEIFIGKFGVGRIEVGVDSVDNVTLYSHVLAPEYIAALAAALPLDFPEPVNWYTRETTTVLTTPTLYYDLRDAAGSAIMVDQATGNNGAYVGTPLLGVPGPLNPERGFRNSGTAARFANNVAQYGVETGRTLADAAGALLVFYAPRAKRVAAGICEKTVGSPGVRDTQWGFCQRNAATGIGVVRFTLKTSTGLFTADAPLIREDLRRFGGYVATWGSGTIEVYKDWVLVASGTYTGTPSSGVGDFYIGIQGTNGAGLTRPGQGDIGLVSYHPTHLTAADVTRLGIATTWYNGGLWVDAVLREPRQAQEYLKQLALIGDLHFGVSATGAITCRTSLVNPAQIQVNARDGAGDGDRTIVAISQREPPSLADTVRDLVLPYRVDLLTGEPLATTRRAVSTQVDAQGRRIGRKQRVVLEMVRAHPTADRLGDRLGKRFKAREDRVRVTLAQEARRLMEGQLVQVTDAHLGYADTVMETKGVGKALATIETELQGWDENANAVYTPAAFPAGATSG